VIHRRQFDLHIDPVRCEFGGPQQSGDRGRGPTEVAVRARDPEQRIRKIGAQRKRLAKRRDGLT
jgi:hypothetical protein